MELPTPRASLTVEAVGINPPGTNRLVVQGVAFQLKAGQGLGVIGPSASGKSSLARAIVGVWPAMRGKVRLDGAALDQWSAEALGRHIGYLPQDVELFAGTVAQNIARFEPTPVGGGDRRGQGRGRARDDPAAAPGLRDPDRRRRRPVRRPAPAHRAGPRAVRRSLPGRARRAQLQPRQRGRRGADPGHPGVRARGGIVVVVATGPARWPASTSAGDAERAASRPSGRRTRCSSRAAGARPTAGTGRAPGHADDGAAGGRCRRTHLDRPAIPAALSRCSASAPCSARRHHRWAGAT